MLSFTPSPAVRVQQTVPSFGRITTDSRTVSDLLRWTSIGPYPLQTPSGYIKFNEIEGWESTIMEAITIDTIFDRVCLPNGRDCPEMYPSASKLKRGRESLEKAWSVLNRWAMERLLRKGTIDVPNFARVGWQHFHQLEGKVRSSALGLHEIPSKSVKEQAS